MSEFSRTLRRWDPLRVAALGAGAAALVLIVGYAIAAATVQPTPGGVVSAVSLLAIAGSGLLYAWRLGAGGLFD